MKLVKQFWILFVLCIISFNSFSQRILVVEKISANVKNIKFKTGDRIIFKVTNKEKIEGYITKIDDSTLTVNNTPVTIKEIKTIYTERTLALLLSSIGIMGGGAYIIVDSFNNIINKESPVFKTESLITGGIMLGAGIISSVFIYKKHTVSNEDWRLKVLNYY